MKISKLLVLSALWLTASGAWAADLVERTAPEEPASAVIDAEALEAINKTAAEFVVGDAYILHNKGTELFYFQGNAWGTQATGAVDQAMIVRFVLPGGKSLDDKQLWLRNYVPSQSRWRTAFVTTGDGKVGGVFGEGTPALFVDNNDGNAALLWVESVGDKTYRISISEANSAAQPEGCFLGIDVNSPGVENGTEGTCILPKLAEGEGVNLDWEFFAIPEWTSYFKEKDVFDKSEELKKIIETAEATGVNVSAAAAVYNNLQSSIEEMQKAMEDLQSAMAGGLSAATPDNPVDATYLIKNPNFDDASNEGWDGTKPNMVGSGSHGPANVAEVYNNTFDTYQTLTALPAGVYVLRANTAFRGSWDDLEKGTPAAAKLYVLAGGEEQSVPFNNIWSCLNTVSMAGATEFGTSAAENGHGSYYSPNDPSAFRLYEEKGFYKTMLIFDIPAGDLQFGVKNPEKCSDGCDNWSIFDTFSLMYYGNEPGSYQKWVELSLPEVPEEALYTDSYMVAYKAAIDAQKATNREEALAAIEVLKPFADALQNNISLWLQWKSAIADAMKMAIDPEYEWTEAAQEFTDYEMDSQDIESALALTNEELEAAIAQINAWKEAMIDEAINGVKEGADVTRFMVNPGFQEGGLGWTVEGGGTSGSPLDNKNFEVYHVDKFDVWQEVKGARPGVYEIQVQGFSRYDGGGVAGDPDSCPDAPIFLYMNTATTRFPNLWSAPMPAGTYGGDERLESWYLATDSQGNEYPNSMGSASQAFDLGLYQLNTFGLVREGETMRIGVKGTNCGDKWWTLWDNFKLVYQGTKADVVKPALEAALENIDVTKPMSKTVKENVDRLIADANAAMESNDGATMFETLTKVYDMIDEIRESVALFEKLENATSSLLDAIGVSEASQDIINEAMALNDEILAGLNASSLSDEDVDVYMGKIAIMKTKLRLPDVNGASDENPIDVTAVMDTPSFEKDGTNSIDGWTATGHKFGNSDQLFALALESWESVFHIYQDIVGLPNGTYVVKVNGWERTATPTYLYAQSGEEYFSKELIKQAEGLPEGYSAPGSLSDAVAQFDEEVFMNQLVVKVSDGKLRVGVEKEATSGSDWIVLDNFQLWYYGANSSLTPDANSISEVGVAKAVKTEFFNLNGARINKAQKGIVIMKQTMSDGTVKVKKVNVR